MNNTTLHHTICNRASARLLLAQQWVERINYQRRTLNDDVAKSGFSGVAKYELDTWAKRTHEDVDVARTRLMKDGYTRIDRGYPIHIAKLLDDSRDIDFTPCIDDLYQQGMVEIWERKAVSNG